MAKTYRGEHLKKKLTSLFSTYSSDIVINDLVENASSQSNESLVPKFIQWVFYGGSESSDQRIAAAVAQTNLGKKYLVDTLHCADIEPGEVTEQKIAMIDYERNAGQKRKSVVDFKQQRKLNYLKTKSRNKSESNREEISYTIGITVTLDPDVLQKGVVTPQELKECKNYVLAFRERPSKKYITCPDDQRSVIGFIFVIFDRETSCGGSQLKSFNY